LAADPSLALGSSSVTLLELTAAYAAVAANEYPIEPHAMPTSTPGLIDRLIHGKRSLGEKTHKQMLDLLRATVIQGTGRAAGLSIPTYGKTGTSQDSRDALFIGFAGDLVVGVWVGRDDNKPLGGMHGGGLPAQIWRAFMGQAIADSIQPEEPENEQLADNMMENVTADLVPEIEFQGADTDLGADPAMDVQGTIGGVDVNVNVNRRGVTVQPGQANPAAPTPAPANSPPTGGGQPPPRP
jgi:penicillin-binding protein 1A